MKFVQELKKVFDEAERETIDQISEISLAFKEQGLKDYIDNEMDFYLGAVIATVFEKYQYKAERKGFTQQQILSTSPLVVISIFYNISEFKKEIKSKIGL
jgi:hypothetical protein